MNIERFIAVYDKDNDSLLEDIKIDLATDVLIDLLNIDRNDDPDAYKVYHLTEAQFGNFKSMIPALEDVVFDQVEIYLECFSIE